MALGLDQSLKIIVSAVDQASSTLGNIRTVVQDLQSDASTTAQTLETIGTGLQGVGRDMTKYVTTPVVAGLGLATKAAADFEERLAILRVAARDTGVDVDTLGAAALAMGEDVRLVGNFSATDALEAMTELAKAGKTGSEMFGDLAAYLEGTAELSGILAAAVDLAAASELNLQQATEALLTTMTTYGIEAEQATEIANAYVQAADASVASVGDLVEGVGNAGTVMQAYGVSLDETLTMLAMLSERSIKGAEAGTNLRSMFNNMLRDTNRTNEALNTFNTTLYDSEGTFKAPIELMEELRLGMQGLTDQERLTAMKDLFGTYGQMAGMPLMEMGAAGFEEMTEKINKAATVEEVAEARSQTFAAQVARLQDALQTFMVTAGTPFIEDFLRPAVEAATELVQKLSEMNPETLNLALRIALIAAVVGPALIALGALARSIASLITLYQLLAGAQAAAGLGAGATAAGAGAGAGAGALAAPAAGLGAGVTLGVAAGGVYLGQHPEIVKSWQDELRKRLGMEALPAGASLGEKLGSATRWLGGLVGLGGEEEEPTRPWQYMPSATGEDLYFPEMPAEVPDIALAEEATTTAADWVGEFESAMAQYDSVFATIGVGGGDALKAGFMYAAEDAGSDFLITIARQLAPELVPYVMEAIAARAATEGPVG